MLNVDYLIMIGNQLCTSQHYTAKPWRCIYASFYEREKRFIREWNGTKGEKI